MAVQPGDFGSCMNSLAEAGLQPQILFPADASYSARLSSYYSNSSKLQPACFLQPRSAVDVATAVKVLVGAGQRFAVVAGGCTPWAGSNNIERGVTIDLALMDSVDFDPSAEIAHIGPGALWGKVYAALETHGRAVAGGRDKTIGVAGFVLGGGNSLFAGRHGLACDSVVAYEVVLADGRIINATATEHADLFRALKGGGNNLGVVTRFSMRTLAVGAVWGGRVILPEPALPQIADAMVDFTANIAKDPDSSVVCARCYMPLLKELGLEVAFSNFYFNTASGARPPAFDKLLAIPEILNTCTSTSLSDVLGNISLPRDYYNVWSTQTVKNDASILMKACELHQELIHKMRARILDGDFIALAIFQPLPRVFAQRAVEAGGNVMGLERHEADGILFQIIVMVRTSEQESWVRPHVLAWNDALRAFASTIEGGVLPWIYLNYADPSQDVFQSYGPENVRRIQEAAARYDPDGVFQRLCPGGFKISAVKP